MDFVVHVQAFYRKRKRRTISMMAWNPLTKITNQQRTMSIPEPGDRHTFIPSLLAVEVYAVLTVFHGQIPMISTAFDSNLHFEGGFCIGAVEAGGCVGGTGAGVGGGSVNVKSL